MAGFTCPYCGMVMAVNSNTHEYQLPSFESSRGCSYPNGIARYDSSTIAIHFYQCPNCDSFTVFAEGVGEAVKDINTIIKPKSSARQFPEYVPQQIRNDYEEACAILHLSPKASATLSRRCLQGMIRDFWGITKGTLNAEINALKDQIPADLWTAIDSLRQLGNIGAHMEKDTSVIVDIDPDEAQRLVSLIELLIKEWYINREERRNLFSSIFDINADKQQQRKGEG